MLGLHLSEAPCAFDFSSEHIHAQFCLIRSWKTMDYKISYDIIFAGFGASSCILIHKLHQSNLLNGKRILILDPQKKIENDKTFCFWANEQDTIVKDFRHIINHEWVKVSFNGATPEYIEPLRYYHISSDRLYHATRKILQNYDVRFLQERIISIREEENGVQIRTDKRELYGALAYDARPPKVTSLNKNHNIWQSFLGYKVNLKEKEFDADACVLMDFSVNQDNNTQFVYILPYSPKEGLIEFTRFGKEVIDEKNISQALKDYIQLHYGEFNIESIEKGKIPMFMDIPKPSATKRIIPIGSRANKIKPSTGYAFKNMYAHAQTLTNNPDSIPSGNKKRFRFYDALLIYILSVWPQLGKSIFQRLFTVKSTNFILQFLDEKTTLKQEISMFSKLHIGIFLKACFFLGIEKLKAFLPILVFSILYFSLQAFFPNVANEVMYGLLALGLFLVGIPHGAIDYKTGALSREKKINSVFIVKYVSIMVLVYLSWWASPTFALLAFILYSAWHFGETDSALWNIKNRYVGFVWGLSFFGALLSSHITEFNLVLTALNIGELAPSIYIDGLFTCSLLIAFYFSLRFASLHWFMVASFLVISSYIPLIMAFLIYFIAHHSWQGWKHLKESLKETNASLFKQALPFNLGALLLFVLFFLNIGENTTYNVSMAFVFISCISLPHILCMHSFYQSRSID